jgi:hypothetical protein
VYDLYTSDILRLRKAQCIDVPEHDSQAQVCCRHHEDDAHAHVKREQAEVYSLQQLRAVIRTLPLLLLKTVFPELHPVGIISVHELQYYYQLSQLHILGP